MSNKERAKKLKYTQYTKDYYTNQISCNPWIKSMNISKDIIQQISNFSNGILRDCNNDNCYYEVSIIDKASNLFEQIHSNSTQNNDGNKCKFRDESDDEELKYKILQVAQESKDKDNVYYHDDTQNISYCTDCAKSMKPCCENGDSMICNGIIFTKANNSYINCTCNRYVKKLCLRHGKCDQCNVSFCGEGCRNIANKEDLCERRVCSSCGAIGCPGCVPMIRCEGCMECDPPEYFGCVWICHNNPNCGGEQAINQAAKKKKSVEYTDSNERGIPTEYDDYDSDRGPVIGVDIPIGQEPSITPPPE